MTHSLKSADIITDTLKKNPLVAAPMAGVSTPPFRLALRDYFDGLMYTEMVSVEGVIRAGKKSLQFLALTERDNPIGLQLFGSKPDSFYEAVRVSENETNADFYDINMGCPVKKVLKSGSGVALMKDTAKIKEIISAARKATEKPITVKFRLGWDRQTINYPEVINIAAGEGANALAIHGRTKTEMFSGNVDYELLSHAVSISPLPVIANGNISDIASLNAIKKTGAAGFMIGRGMMKAPWIFKALNENKNPDNYLSSEEIRSLIFRMKGYEMHRCEERYCTDTVKKYAVWFTKGLPESTTFRGDVYAAKDMHHLEQTINSYFDTIALTTQP